MSLVISGYTSDGDPIYEEQSLGEGADNSDIDMGGGDGSDDWGPYSTTASGNRRYYIGGNQWVEMTPDGQYVDAGESDPNGTGGSSPLTGISKQMFDGLKNFFKDPVTGKYNMAGILAAGAGLYSLLGGSDVKNDNMYKGKVDMGRTMVRAPVRYGDHDYMQGTMGKQFFTPTQYVASANAPAAQTAADTQARGIAALATPEAPPAPPALTRPVDPPPEAAPYGPPQAPPPSGPPVGPPADSPTGPSVMTPAQLAVVQTTGKYAAGGMAGLDTIGASHNGYYLGGPTDGMADELDTTIDGEQPAKLSHGEFVIPADVVSHLGNGNSDAGAQKLYDLMARVRKARTGNPEQGKQINPDKFLGGIAGTQEAACGGMMGYDAGGEVKKFDGGGTTGTGTGTTTTGSTTVPYGTTTSTGLSNWAGDYVTGMLSDANAAGNAPYQAYTGPTSAGASNLQNQAFAGASNLSTPTSVNTASTGLGSVAGQAAGIKYDPTTFTQNTWDSSAASKYMNPYLMNALNPQLDELRRQNSITNTQDNAKMTQAGAFGGSRQAILNAENNRNMLGEQSKVLGTGFKNAYDTALSQWNTEQNRGLDTQKATEQSKQFGAELGLKGLDTAAKAYTDQGQLGIQQNQANINNLDEQAKLGGQQRDIVQQGIAADQKQFEDQRDYPYKMLQFKRDMLTGLPISTTSTTADQTGLSSLLGNAAQITELYRLLSGVFSPSSTSAATGTK